MSFQGSPTDYRRCFYRRELSPILKELLGVDNLWCDTRTEAAAQKFVLWAGYVLEARPTFRDALRGRRFAFSVLVHADGASDLVDFLATSSVLQVGFTGCMCNTLRAADHE